MKEKEKTTYYISPFIWDLHNRYIHRDRKQISVCQRMAGGGIGLLMRI